MANGRGPQLCGRDDCKPIADALKAVDAKPARKRSTFPPKLREQQIPERAVLHACLEYLARKNVFAWRQNQGSMKMPNEVDPANPFRRRKNRFIRFAGVDGISDIIGIYKGRFLAIETKRVGKKPTKEQRDFLDAIEKGGGIAIVAFTVDDVINALAAVDRGER